MAQSVRVLTAAALATALLAACDAPTGIDAQANVVADTVALYGLNDAPVGAPTAFSLFNAATGTGAVEASTAFRFDVAVDVAADGAVRLLPNSRVGNVLAPVYRVGLQRVTQAFDAVTIAPLSGYAYDSVLVVRPGETVVVESSDNVACPVAFLGTTIYAKLVVDSVRTAEPSRVFLRAVTDPNCGFRSLVAGSKPTE